MAVSNTNASTLFPSVELATYDLNTTAFELVACKLRRMVPCSDHAMSAVEVVCPVRLVFTSKRNADRTPTLSAVSGAVAWNVPVAPKFNCGIIPEPVDELKLIVPFAFKVVEAPPDPSTIEFDT